MSLDSIGEPLADIEGEPERRTGTGRLEAFSDGVLAIVVTLLVLELRVPAHRRGALLTSLLHQWPGYVGYLASFLYVGVIWLNHHSAFTRVRAVDRGLHLTNLGVLFTTALIPFPTSVLSQSLTEGFVSADARVAVGLYALIAAAMCVSWLVLYSYLHRHEAELVEPDVMDSFFAHERKRAVLGVIGYAVAGVIGVTLVPAIALVIFVLLPAFYAATNEGVTSRPRVARHLGPRRR